VTAIYSLSSFTKAAAQGLTGRPFRVGCTAAKGRRRWYAWLRKLPHPYSANDRQAGHRYQVSILQAECSLTQVLDRPQTGRIFFEELIRENLDLGRPDQVQLVFERRVRRDTPGRFRTRVCGERSHL
jgi:hypothetical protein